MEGERVGSMLKFDWLMFLVIKQRSLVKSEGAVKREKRRKKWKGRGRVDVGGRALSIIKSIVYECYLILQVPHSKDIHLIWANALATSVHKRRW